MTAPSSALSTRLLRTLQDRDKECAITVLRRGAAPLHLSGWELHRAACDLIAGWDACFGSGRHTFVVALPAGDAFLSVLVGALLAGHVVVPASTPRMDSRSGRLAHIVSDSRATAVLCSESGRASVVAALGGDGALRRDCVVTTVEDVLAGKARTAQVVAGAAAAATRDGPVVIQYTSGSTQHPKGVCISGANLLANLELSARAWQLRPDSRIVNWMPHYHDMGLMGGILYPLLAGAYSVQMSPLEMIRSPSTWLQAISDHRASFSGGPAFAFAECLRRISDSACGDLDLSCWSHAFCGAEPVPAALLREFRRRFAPYGLDPRAVFACYGLAEYTLFAAGAPGAEVQQSAPSESGGGMEPCRLQPGAAATLRIVDPQSHLPLGEDEAGEIWLRGESAARGYLALDHESRRTFGNRLPCDEAPDWLRTGDLGFVRDGALHVTGRLKDILIARGQKIAAAEIEYLAASVDEALNPLAAAAFAPDPAQGGVAALLIELKPDATPILDEAAMQAAVARLLLGEHGLQLQEFRLLPRGSLPRTTSGKIRRHEVARRFREERGARDDTAADPLHALA